MPKTYTGRQLSARYPTDLAAWQSLKEHHAEMRKRTLKELFTRDKRRSERFTVEAGNLALDYSRNHVNATTRKLFGQLARAAGVPAAIEAMFAGERINETEGRSVLHVALRSKISDQVALETTGVREVWEVLTRMEEFVEAVQSGTIVGNTGKRLSEIVNIGIGGSDLGPEMASRALRPYWNIDMRFHSVSNVDGTQLADLMDELDPEHQKLVSDMIPTQITVSALQRVLKNLLHERVSIRDLPSILEGVSEAVGFTQNPQAITEHVRARLSRQICFSAIGAGGYVPLVTLSPDWEQAFAESLTGQGEEMQLSMPPSRLQEFINAVRESFERFAMMGEVPVLLTSPGTRPYVRSIVERFRPATTVMSQNEIHPKARLKTLGQL